MRFGAVGCASGSYIYTTMRYALSLSSVVLHNHNTYHILTHLNIPISDWISWFYFCVFVLSTVKYSPPCSLLSYKRRRGVDRVSLFDHGSLLLCCWSVRCVWVCECTLRVRTPGCLCFVCSVYWLMSQLMRTWSSWSIFLHHIQAPLLRNSLTIATLATFIESYSFFFSFRKTSAIIL